MEEHDLRIRRENIIIIIVPEVYNDALTIIDNMNVTLTRRLEQ